MNDPRKTLLIGGKVAKIGQTVFTGKGEECILERIDTPWKPSSTGRVGVRLSCGSYREYFPNVIGATWKEKI